METPAVFDQRWNTFYRAYPWLKHRLETLDALLHPGTKTQTYSSVTLTAGQVHEARALLTDLVQHLERCYSAEAHDAFRRPRAHHP